MEREPGKPAFALMAERGTGRYVGSAFVTLNRENRERLWRTVQAHSGPPPKGMKRPATQWVRQGLIGRVKHLRGEEDHLCRTFAKNRRPGVPIHQRAKEAGIFDVAELALLARVYDRLRYDEQTADQRQVLASRIIANFMAGITDENELVSLSRLPLGR